MRIRLRKQPTAAPACRAPFSSLYLSPLGDVRACCQNNFYALGSITESTLSDIWFGPKADALRAALGDGRYDLGCESCGNAVRLSDRSSAYAATFDHLDLRSPNRQYPAQLELALSNACNLQCAMCNGDLSSAIRLHREGRPPLPRVYDDAFFDELATFVPHLRSVVLLGGEPFLAAEAMRVIELLEHHNPNAHVHVTTNGTISSDRVLRFIAHQPCHIAVSLDGATSAVNDSIRQGASFDVVVANLERFRDTARANGSDVSISFTLQRGNAVEFVDLLELADRLDVDVVVNRLYNPVAQSIFHADLDELETALQRLDAGVESGRLQRNLAVAEREQQALGAHLTQRHSEIAQASASSSTTVTSSIDELDQPADGVVIVAASGVVERVEQSEDWAGSGWDALVGVNPVEIIGLLQHDFGELTHSTLDFVDGDEVRVLSFRRDDVDRRVTARAVPQSDGSHRWELRVAVVDG